MNQTIQNLLSGTPADLSLTAVIFAILSSALLSIILKYFYRRFGRSMSEKMAFSNNFVLIAITTTLIIMVVKSSLALSLGLVGALSIIRFRTAIKDPEELSYLFLCISIGLGFGAGQIKVTYISFVVILGVIFILSLIGRKESSVNHFFIVSGSLGIGDDMESIIECLRPFCTRLLLSRFEENESGWELVLEAEIGDYRKLSDARASLKAIREDLNISMIQSNSIRNLV
jgi:hypothetical protein